MPLSATAQSMLASMKKRYGDQKGEQVFYAYLNKHPDLKTKFEGKKSKGGKSYNTPIKHLQ